jgi:hypothetical protein
MPILKRRQLVPAPGPVRPLPGELMGNPGADKSARMTRVMPEMKKIIVADLQKAYDGE